MFRTLHSWQYLYIPYTVFMVALLLYFVRYVHGYMKSQSKGPQIFAPPTLLVQCFAWRFVSILTGNGQSGSRDRKNLTGCYGKYYDNRSFLSNFVSYDNRNIFQENMLQQLCKARDLMDFSEGLLNRTKAPHNCIS